MGKTMWGLLAIMMICGLASGSGAEILFEEDFSDGTADGFTEDSDLWSVTPSGRYTIDLYGNEVFSWSFIGNPGWRDYTFSMDIRSKDSKNHIAAVRGAWQKLAVSVVGSTISVSENGTEILNYSDTDEPLLAGGAAVVALAGGLVMHQELFVDNLLVESLEGKSIVPTEETTWSHLKALYR